MTDTLDKTLRAQVEAKPRVKFVCERDWLSGPNAYAIGFLWDRNFDAQPGEFIYRHRWLVRLHFALWIERY